MHHGRNLNVTARHRKLRLKALVLDPTDLRQPISRRALEHSPFAHVCRAVPADVAGPATATTFFDDEARSSLWCPMPFLPEPTVALHQIVGAEPCAPTYVLT